MALPRWLGHGAMSLLIHARDVAAESCWLWHYRATLAMAWCRYLVMLAMVLPRRRWPWRHVTAESCCDGATEVTLGVAWCHCQVLLAMVLPRQRWPWRDVISESCWWWCRCYRVDVGHGAMSLPSHGGASVLSPLSHDGDGIAGDHSNVTTGLFCI
jgi:hypothetical protein